MKIKTLRQILIALILSTPYSLLFAQNLTPCSLIKTNLFTISRHQIAGEGSFNIKIAVDSKNTIALSSCNKKYIFFIDVNGVPVDSAIRPCSACIRNMEFDEHDNLLMIDNNERYIYRISKPSNKIDSIPYNKPEDWYDNLNHYYKNYELSSVPAYFYNPNYIQESYFTRFNYGYNFYINYKTGIIYQSNYNFIKRLGTKRTYEKMRKEDFWFSDLVNNKTKILLIDDSTKRAIFFDRALKLVCEDFVNDKYEIYDCGYGITEPAQFDFGVSMNEDMVYGVGYFSKDFITISTWKFADEMLRPKGKGSY